jgi:hypothetical protein
VEQNKPKRQMNTPNGFKVPNGHKICRSIPLQELPKCIKLCIFGLNIYHLATLGSTPTWYVQQEQR